MGEVQRGSFRGQSQLPGWLKSFLAMLMLGWVPSSAVAQEPPVTLRFDVVGGTLVGEDENLSSWQLAVASPPPACLDVEIDVVLVSRLANCTENPEYCTRGEGSLDGYDGCGGGVLGCEDGEDNDGDGLTDLEDPDCRGVHLWRFSLEADPSFTIEEATTSGTAADLLLFPPGKRDLCSLHGTDRVEAAANGGRSGALSVVALSITSTITLPPVSDTVVLKIRGKLSTQGLALPGDRTAPSLLRFIPPDETGLATTGNPVNAAVFAGGELPVELSNATVELVLPEVGNAAFLRGDVDGDGEPTLTDGIALLNFLFLGAKTPECRDAADEDDNGTLDLSDATHLFQFLFRGGDAPGAPGTSTCGIDPTEDVLDCLEYAACPTSADGACPAPEPRAAPLALCRGVTLDGMSSAVAVGDFDGNGLPDLAAGTSEGLAVSLNLGDGSFTFSHAAAFQDRARDIGLGDIDGDGEVDIVAASGGRLLAMVNLVDGTFTEPVPIEASEPAQTLALADTDGDGILDIVSASEEGRVLVHHGEGNGEFVEQEAHHVSSGSGASIAAADLNNDEAPDIVALFWGTTLSGAWVLLNQGDGTFRADESTRYFSGLAPRALSLGDVDGDGTLDMVVATTALGPPPRREREAIDSVEVRLGGNDGTFGDAWSATFGTVGFCPETCGEEGNMVLGDINGDGRADAVLSRAIGGQIGIFLGRADGTLEVPSVFVGTPVSVPGRLALANFQGDDRLDLAVAGSSQIGILVGCDSE